jgi:hypothetical protein
VVKVILCTKPPVPGQFRCPLHGRFPPTALETIPSPAASFAFSEAWQASCAPVDRPLIVRQGDLLCRFDLSHQRRSCRTTSLIRFQGRPDVAHCRQVSTSWLICCRHRAHSHAPQRKLVVRKRGVVCARPGRDQPPKPVQDLPASVGAIWSVRARWSSKGIIGGGSHCGARTSGTRTQPGASARSPRQAAVSQPCRSGRSSRPARLQWRPAARRNTGSE